MNEVAAATRFVPIGLEWSTYNRVADVGDGAAGRERREHARVVADLGLQPGTRHG